ncbi:MAG: hypothetical protein AB9836_12310 [Aminipila sp.]
MENKAIEFSKLAEENRMLTQENATTKALLEATQAIVDKLLLGGN